MGDSNEWACEAFKRSELPRRRKSGFFRRKLLEDAGYIEVPKKNGTLFSGMSLCLLAGDGEPGAEVYSAALDRDQASIVSKRPNMVEFSAAFSSRLSVVRSTKRIAFHKTKSFYEAFSADVPARKGSMGMGSWWTSCTPRRTRSYGVR